MTADSVPLHAIHTAKPLELLQDVIRWLAKELCVGRTERHARLLIRRLEAARDDLEALRAQMYVLAGFMIRAAIREKRFADATAVLDADEREDVEERAAIVEFDGKLSREQAERLALSPYTRRLRNVS